VFGDLITDGYEFHPALSPGNISDKGTVEAFVKKIQNPNVNASKRNQLAFDDSLVDFHIGHCKLSCVALALCFPAATLKELRSEVDEGIRKRPKEAANLV